MRTPHGIDVNHDSIVQCTFQRRCKKCIATVSVLSKCSRQHAYLIKSLAVPKSDLGYFFFATDRCMYMSPRRTGHCVHFVLSNMCETTAARRIIDDTFEYLMNLQRLQQSLFFKSSIHTFLSQAWCQVGHKAYEALNWMGPDRINNCSALTAMLTFSIRHII